ncbi:Endonuclease/exonuclease/phosphatase [Schizophyllum fasciatum]
MVNPVIRKLRITQRGHWIRPAENIGKKSSLCFAFEDPDGSALKELLKAKIFMFGAPVRVKRWVEKPRLRQCSTCFGFRHLSCNKTHCRRPELPKAPPVQRPGAVQADRKSPVHGDMILRPLRVLQLNVARSNVRMHALLNTLTSFDIVLFQEPWFNRIGSQRSDTSPVGTPVFGTVANAAWDSFVPLAPRENPPPRVAAFARRGVPHLHVRARPDVVDSPDLLTLHLTYGSVSLYIINVYNEGAGPSSAHSVQRLREAELDPLVPTVICGDFNLHHPSWALPDQFRPASSTADDLVDWAEENSFSLLNDTSCPTRIGRQGQSNSIIDLTWSNFVADEFNIIQDWHCTSKLSLESDHNAITWSLVPFQDDNLPPTEALEHGHRIDPARRDDWCQNFRTRLDQAPLGPYLSTEDVEAAARVLLDCMRDATSTVMPRRSGRTPLRAPWWNDDCDLAIHSLKTASGQERSRARGQFRAAMPRLKRSGIYAAGRVGGDAAKPLLFGLQQEPQ